MKNRILCNLATTDLIRYALSLKGPDGIVVGIDSINVVKSNLDKKNLVVDEDGRIQYGIHKFEKN